MLVCVCVCVVCVRCVCVCMALCVSMYGASPVHLLCEPSYHQALELYA